MKLAIKPIKAKWHMLLFLTASLGLYLFMFWHLYSNAQQIREQTSTQALQTAQQELVEEIKHFIEVSTHDALRLVEWDEVRQQLSQPRYYFFWRNERVKVSHQWRAYFNELEIYDAQGAQLFQKGPNDPVSPYLPEQVPAELSSFNLYADQLNYRLFVEVKQRHTHQSMGYVGLNLNLVEWLKKEGQFKFIERRTIGVQPSLMNHELNIQHLLTQPENYLQFSVVDNPVDNYLWSLIQDFIRYVLLYAVLIAILFVLFFRFSLAQPLKGLTRYLTELKNKPDQVVLPECHCLISEFEDLKTSLMSYNQALVLAQNKINAQRELAYQQSRTDSLSGLANRRGFDEALYRLEADGLKLAESVGFILFDCDYFKAINDSYGHDVGDDVIRLTAQALLECLPARSQTFRIGGDEFAVVVERTDLVRLRDVADQCLGHLKQMSFEELGIKERVQFSVGVSFTHQADLISKLHKHADIALYKAKHSLHDKVQLYIADDVTAGKTLVSNERVSQIMEALQTGVGIDMHLQPIVDTEQNIGYYESLIRIRSEQGLIYPGEIFDVVNHRHLEIDLDIKVIDALTELLIAGKVPANTGVSLNLSTKTLLQMDLQALLQPLFAFTAKYKMVIEVTETTLITNMALVTEKLTMLRQTGFSIALDDFGSGYSSIRYLANMPVDIVKFDMTLTQALELDAKTRGIIQSTASMIRQAGYQLVMEGVETQAQFTAAKKAGATGLQGYYFGRPQSVSCN